MSDTEDFYNSFGYDLSDSEATDKILEQLLQDEKAYEGDTDDYELSQLLASQRGNESNSVFESYGEDDDVLGDC